MYIKTNIDNSTLILNHTLDFKIITLYGGLGYNSGSTTAKMKGDYTLTYDVEDNNGVPLGTAQETVSNPINLDFDANGVRATIGTRLNLGFFKKVVLNVLDNG
jgi:hypothetical protein